MIQLEKVEKRFGEQTLFSGVSMKLQPGKIYALIGASGSGKSTLLNILAKLETYEGNLFYHGKELREYQTTQFFRHELGYLFQNFGLMENETIEANLKLGLVGQKLSKSECQKKELEALAQVGLSYLDLEKRIFELSGGEAQRVALAKVILKNPPLILADEPTASVDPETSKAIMEMLLSLRNENRIIVIATHSPSIWNLTDEVIRMEYLTSKN
ncbi:putative bacteriocin export ABC transporter [Aerococcaceae bacterium zg-BR9]|uniref:putative bacteriocin export ABC transporter n=1 Tax=Aerococcaceae bacterium zg-1292 TaxID=2774330 RepID=UPI004063F04C|nr:putative bacteriocin export ABC transporter [Aerococcaceae bacterium zg-BR9]